jgi:hypothetical protein
MITPILRTKPTVDLAGLQPEILFGLLVAWTVYASFGYDCVVTRARDRDKDQLTNSLHNRDGICRAVDLRTKHVNTDQLSSLHHCLKQSLPPDFDCVLEDDHIHLEWDQKEPVTDSEHA